MQSLLTDCLDSFWDSFPLLSPVGFAVHETYRGHPPGRLLPQRSAGRRTAQQLVADTVWGAYEEYLDWLCHRDERERFEEAESQREEVSRLTLWAYALYRREVFALRDSKGLDGCGRKALKGAFEDHLDSYEVHAMLRRVASLALYQREPDSDDLETMGVVEDSDACSVDDADDARLEFADPESE